MALSSKLPRIYFRFGTLTYSFKVKDASLDIGQVNYGSPYDEAVDGFLRSNIRGFRMRIDLPINKLYSSQIKKSLVFNSSMDEFLNDMIIHLIDNQNEFLEISFDATNYYSFIPDTTSYGVSYTNQIARGNGSLKFIGLNIIKTIPPELTAPAV